jgi:hypothetical protein
MTGGAILFATQAPAPYTITSSTFYLNSAPADSGGAIFCFGVLEVTNCSFLNNTAAAGMPNKIYQCYFSYK